ncbi:Aspartic proteinase nepenthesin-1 [Rhynchospora pubera]|uniref:Aspartic proteinase nepenthesin-1 n=1 Tax=Rhynchospora pubera TaxID=906938 RepID=A0AAV8HJ20_9POAL|nr:Aspartic proteinase nepenthesin-1 [Rhynchospora pubera]KAJ4817642.1 Aspartic proteinase nepenthesin-1 [Rhynchospora pubera]
MRGAQMLQIVPLLLIYFLAPTSSTSPDIRLNLKHVDTGSGYTKLELLQRAAVRSSNRAARVFAGHRGFSGHITAQEPVEPHEGEYLIELAIGTPGQAVLLTLDTGSDLIWTQCQPCLICFNQSFPLYNPTVSSTYYKYPCSGKLCNALSLSACHEECMYGYGYGDNSTTFGILSSESFTLGSTDSAVTVQDVGFGCGVLNRGIFLNESGIAGFGRGALSLASQLGVGKFAYCLTSFDQNNTSPLFMGSLAKLHGPVQTTPILTNPTNPTFYYLSLKGITVGTRRLKLPKSVFQLKKNGKGGVILDSGTAITRMAQGAFQQVKRAFVSQTKLKVARDLTGIFDLCFLAPPSNSSHKVIVPRLVFHFDGADMEFPQDNYINIDQDTGLLCLLILESDEETIIGNIQQQNMKILYDLEKERLSFVPAQCDRL